MIVFSAWRPGRAVLPGWPGSPAAGRLPGGPAIAGPGSVSGGAWLLPPPVAVLDLAPVPHTFVPGAAAGQGLRAASVRGVLLPRDSSWANVACGMLATTDRLRMPFDVSAALLGRPVAALPVHGPESVSHAEHGSLEPGVFGADAARGVDEPESVGGSLSRRQSASRMM